MNYLYLHGFASGPQSQKAKFLQNQFAKIGLTLPVPDLNLGDFTQITLSAQLQYLNREFGDRPLIAIGSSLGGFLALQMAIANPQIEKLVLLAPAFEFGQRLAEGLGAEAIAQWQATGSRDFFHYSLNRQLPLKYEFFADAQTYAGKTLNRNIPILIIHGLQDEVIPFQLSQAFAESHPDVTLRLVESDHSLGGEMLGYIWQETASFLDL
ncbi:YqiA/YcfP family alpha/beta fold hydrolase [Tumidithrix elongata RA019]|uniref:YqiA/YcfP family alpha/beta fold hydrolase n=1 Tax=Tumidithrix elongata BACA0141 TaxID=2716417 RepID=A0AAW9PRA1_9CYAN|nr:YqiA/YcfP family alpha/beta fold hydrolase [Tumidithrix elongata RA019]